MADEVRSEDAERKGGEAQDEPNVATEGSGDTTDLHRLLAGPGTSAGRHLSADVLVLHGEIGADCADRFINLIPEKQHRAAGVLLALITPGGDADAAFRIARSLQLCYTKVTILIPGRCKSAGTLIAAGAHHIIMADGGELGPLDVQLLKADDMFERTSGLVIDSALDFLETRAIAMFNRFVSETLNNFGPRLSMKTASHHAATLVAELMGRIYAQFDPIKIGENYRHVRVAQHYCRALNVMAGNFVTAEAIDVLISYFPSHSIVIDRILAKEIFNRVDEPDATMLPFVDALRKLESSIDAGPTLGRIALDGQLEVEYTS